MAEEDTRSELQRLLDQGSLHQKALGRLVRIIDQHRRASGLLLGTMRGLDGDREFRREVELKLEFFREAEHLVVRLIRLRREPPVYTRFRGPGVRLKKAHG